MSASPVAASRIGGGMGGGWLPPLLWGVVPAGFAAEGGIRAFSDRVAMPARMPVGLVASEDILPKKT